MPVCFTPTCIHTTAWVLNSGQSVKTYNFLSFINFRVITIQFGLEILNCIFNTSALVTLRQLPHFTNHSKTPLDNHHPHSFQIGKSYPYKNSTSIVNSAHYFELYFPHITRHTIHICQQSYTGSQSSGELFCLFRFF